LQVVLVALIEGDDEGHVPTQGGQAEEAESIVPGVYGVRSTFQAQYSDACWQWISFLSEQMPSDAQYPRRLMPARKSLAESAT
jgi:hypothetical protein